MSENAAAPSAAALHLSTVIAIALVAYALTNIAHEGVGHGGMCLAMGGEPKVLNAVYSTAAAAASPTPAAGGSRPPGRSSIWPSLPGRRSFFARASCGP